MAATGAIIGGVLSAAGSIGGGLLSQPDEESVRASGLLFGVPFTQFDPLLAGLSEEALLALAQPESELVARASPFQQALDISARSTLFERGFIPRLQEWISRLNAEIDRRVQAGEDPQAPGFPNAVARTLEDRFGTFDFDVVTRMATLAGFRNTQEFIRTEIGFRQQAGQVSEALDPLRRELLEGRIAAFRTLADVAEGTGFETLQEQARGEVERQRQAILQAANVGGFNPARALLELEGEGELRATERALQVLGSRAALAQGLLQPAQQFGLQTSQLRQTGALTSAQIASQQAQAIAALSAQNQALQSQALGAGVSGAASALGGTASTLGLFDLLKQLEAGGPATGAGAAGGGGGGGGGAIGAGATFGF